jgi:hypothetical protein
MLPSLLFFPLRFALGGEGLLDEGERDAMQGRQARVLLDPDPFQCFATDPSDSNCLVFHLSTTAQAHC